MIISIHQSPPENNFVVQWVRGLDPWHADAFPPEHRHAGTGGERKAGWEGLDWVGNLIVFVADGTVVDESDDR